MNCRQKPPRPQPRPPRSPGPIKAHPTPPDGLATTFFALPKRRSEAPPQVTPTPESAVHVRAVPTPSSGAPKRAPKPVELRGSAPRSPFQVTQPAPPPPAQRARSWRVYGIVLSLFALCFMGMVTAIVTLVVGTELAAAQTEHLPVHHAAAPTNEADLADTGLPPPPPPPPPARGPRQPVHTPAKHPSTAPTIARPSAAPGTIGITVSGATFLQVEAKCPGIRKRGAFANGKATIQGIPANVECDLHFKGGMPAKFIGVQAGNSYNCIFVQGTAVCKA